jgi:hypothetical protein
MINYGHTRVMTVTISTAGIGHNMVEVAIILGVTEHTTKFR